MISKEAVDHKQGIASSVLIVVISAAVCIISINSRIVPAVKRSDIVTVGEHKSRNFLSTLLVLVLI